MAPENSVSANLFATYLMTHNCYQDFPHCHTPSQPLLKFQAFDIHIKTLEKRYCRNYIIISYFIDFDNNILRLLLDKDISDLAH